MDITVFAILLAIASIGLVSLVGMHSGALKRSYYQGVRFWNRFLPVIAAITYLTILASNVAQGSSSSLHLGETFTFTEHVLLFLVGPLLLTRLGNILATALLLFAFQRVVVFGAMETGAPTFLFMASLTIIAVLGDRMPWIPSRSMRASSHKLKETMLTMLTIGALGVLVATIIKIHMFQIWVKDTMHQDISVYLLLVILVALAVGWLFVALGVSRVVNLPILSLPTTVALAYITGWDAYMLVIPFSMCLAFSLSIADRRYRSRRRSSTYRPGIYAYGRS